MPKPRGTAKDECRVHKIIADVALLAEDHVLMVRYKDTAMYDGERGWFLPDDFARRGEHPEEAAKRILNEQVGVAPGAVRLSHVESFTGGPEDAWHLVFHYAAKAAGRSRAEPSANVAAAEWFRLDRLPPRSEVAHGGWALETLQEIRKAA